MERLHGPIDPCILEEANVADMRFLEMLKSVEMKTDRSSVSSMSSFVESNVSFGVLLKLQQYQKNIDHRQVVVVEEEEEERQGSGVVGPPPGPAALNRRKRKKTRPLKNREEMESHRMTHIAVERNRRRQMNAHLNELRSLMPPSYVQRGDQASIIGGAIDFIKELEQLLHTLQGDHHKRLRSTAAMDHHQTLENPISCSSSCSNFTSKYEKNQEGNGADNNNNFNNNDKKIEGLMRAETKSKVADVEVTWIYNHVNLKIRWEKRHSQLIKVVLALEGLALTVLHLNVNSSETSLHYCFSLRVEDHCKLRSAMEIAEAINQILA